MNSWGGRFGAGVMIVGALLLPGLGGCAPNTMVATGSPQALVTAIPSGTADPRALAAVHTYEAFNRTLAAAQKRPVARGRAYPTEADFSRYSVDPPRAKYESAIAELSLAKRKYRGRRPSSQIIVTSIDLGAESAPTVVLSDCLAGLKGWQEYDTRTGQVVEPDEPPASSTPHGLTVTVIFYHQRWGVQTIEPDPTRACKG